MKVVTKMKPIWCERAGLRVLDDNWLVTKIVNNFKASGYPNSKTRRTVTGEFQDQADVQKVILFI